MRNDLLLNQKSDIALLTFLGSQALPISSELVLAAVEDGVDHGADVLVEAVLAGELLGVDKYNVTLRPAGAASTILLPKHAIAWVELAAEE